MSEIPAPARIGGGASLRLESAHIPVPPGPLPPQAAAGEVHAAHASAIAAKVPPVRRVIPSMLPSPRPPRGTFRAAGVPSDSVRSGRLLLVASVLAAFALGVASRALVPARASGRAEGGPPLGASAGEPATPSACVDPGAMAANAQLVTEAHACHAALASARTESERAAALAATRARSAATLLDPGMSREDWAQAAQTGAVVLRTPCATHRERRSYELVRPTQRRFAGGPLPETGARAEAAGLSPEELTAVDDAYARAHERTWAKLKTACTALLPEDEEDDESRGTFARITRCRHLATAKVDHAAVGRLAELRSAGHAPSRATRPEDAVLLALVESQEELARALTEALGAEKATRAVAFGVTCSQETIVFAPPVAAQPT